MFECCEIIVSSDECCAAEKTCSSGFVMQSLAILPFF